MIFIRQGRSRPWTMSSGDQRGDCRRRTTSFKMIADSCRRSRTGKLDTSNNPHQLHSPMRRIAELHTGGTIETDALHVAKQQDGSAYSRLIYGTADAAAGGDSEYGSDFATSGEGMSSSRGGKGKRKGKEKVPPPPPPPLSKKDVEVFDLDTEKLDCDMLQPGSFRQLLWSIRLGVVRRAIQERNTAEKLARLGPPKVHQKPVLPITKERFVVRVTNSDRQKVCFLFNWWNLYQIAYYVEDDKNEANRCWYFGEDVNESMLPPKTQFPYDSVMGKGLFVLPTNSSYGSLGKMNVKTGKVAIDGYIRTLFTIRDKMTRTGKHMQRLVIGETLEKELLKGPLAFGPVLISEPSRFADYQFFVLDHIYLEVEVPLEYILAFTNWSSLSKRVRDELGFSLFCSITNEMIPLTAHQVWAKIAMLCNSILDIED